MLLESTNVFQEANFWFLRSISCLHKARLREEDVCDILKEFILLLYRNSCKGCRNGAFQKSDQFFEEPTKRRKISQANEFMIYDMWCIYRRGFKIIVNTVWVHRTI